jgi:hypothetical protein
MDFYQGTFAKAYAKAEPRPHIRAVNSLSSAERDRQKRCINQVVSSDMEVMVECAPSGRPKKKYVYRITEKGEDLYEYLQTTPIAAILGNSDVQLVRSKHGDGLASGGSSSNELRLS